MSHPISSRPGMLSRFTIRTRIWGGFGALIVIACLLNGIGLHNSFALGDALQLVTGLNAQNQRVLGIRANLETVRLATSQYMLTHGDDAITTVRTAGKAAQEGLADATQMAGSDTAQQAFHGVAARVSEYQTGFNRLLQLGALGVELRTKLRNLDGEFTATTWKVTSLAQRSGDDRVLIRAMTVDRAVQNCRAAAWRLLGLGGSGSTAVFDYDYDQAMTALNSFAAVSADDLRLAIERLAELTTGFRDGLRLVAATLADETKLYQDTLAPLMATTAADLDGAVAAQATAAQASQAEAISAAELSNLVQAGGGIAGLCLGLGAAVLIAGGIARPLSGMTSAMARLADGDLDVEIPARHNRDELGAIAQAMDVFKQRLQAARATMEREAGEQALKVERAAGIERMIKGFERKVGGVLDSLVRATADQHATAAIMNGATDQTAHGIGQVAERSEAMAANVQTVAVATEELSASIAEIGRQMEQSAAIAVQAVTEAEIATRAIQGMATLASRVDSVVQIISDIAGQTNLLALNATIEAARAGEAGKGFAVVASEVKALANRTGSATEEISAQIKDMQAATDASVGRIGGIGTIIAEMSTIATSIASAVEQQGAATREIARNVQEAARGTADVSAAIGGVRDLAAESGAAAIKMHETSDEMARQGEALKAEVEDFLAGIRAA